jgi:superfamily I DNA and/or RNA helicase
LEKGRVVSKTKIKINKLIKNKNKKKKKKNKLFNLANVKFVCFIHSHVSLHIPICYVNLLESYI